MVIAFYEVHNTAGLPVRKGLMWKYLYMADLKLKRNWKKGLCRQTVLAGHSHRLESMIVCVVQEMIFFCQ